MGKILIFGQQVQNLVRSNIGIQLKVKFQDYHALKKSVTEVLPSCFSYRPKCTTFAIILSTCMQM
jgi:hypothetical protein